MDQILAGLLEKQRAIAEWQARDYPEDDNRDCIAAFERHAERVADIHAIHRAGIAAIRGSCRSFKKADAALKGLHGDFERRIVASLRVFFDDLEEVFFRQYGIKTKEDVQ